MTGLDEYGPQQHEPAPVVRRERPRRSDFNEDEDAEYRLALEASRVQEEEDRRKRESRLTEDDDDDLAKAIKLSKEEEDRRRRELEDNNASSLFDDEPAQPTSQPQFTGFNGGYQQGSAVDFFANPIDQNQMMAQPTGYPMANAYTGYQPQQQTGYQYPNGFGPQPTGFDAFGQQQMQPQLQQQSFQPQPTGYNPYAQQQQFQQQPQPQIQEPVQQSGSNNPWASNNSQSSLKPMPTGSNNPFAQQQQQQQSFSRPQAFKAPSMPTLGSLPEQKTLTSFPQSNPSFTQPTPQAQPQKETNEHEARLNALLASGDGMDTFGNTGNLRIPAQHTAPGTFVNSAGAGLNRLTAEATGNNPFLRQQFTGMPNVTYGQQPAATGPAGMNGFGQGTNNPFAGRQQQQQGGQGDLIQF